MNSLRSLDIKYVKGIGPARAELLEKQLGIRTACDLLRHYPTHYIDRSKFYAIRDLDGDMPAVQVRGRFVSFNTVGEGARTRLIGLFTDGTRAVDVVWFKGISYIKKKLLTETEYVLFGKPTQFNGRWQFSHPEVEIPGTAQAEARTRGVYPLTETLRNRNIGSRQFQTWIQNLLDSRPPLSETLPASVIARLGLMSLNDAIRAIHNPPDNPTLQRARLRLKFEEVFLIQVDMLRRNRRRRQDSRGHLMPHVGPAFNDFYAKCLPFALTGAQKRVIKEIRADLLGGRQMNRLVQGDVGSGKTIVALMAMLLAVDNGMQACLMAPTEILATQHFDTISEMLRPIGVNVALLKGSTPAGERRRIHQALLDGSLHILIGTHALIEDNVRFRTLGMAVIDEQHRFGVAQRARLWTKNDIGPHVLVMTATPIPRTLAMTVYGDLDVSVLDELPPGRKPIATLLRFEPQRLQVYQATYAQLRAGRQVYIVYPLIDENEKLDLHSLTEGYDIIRDTFRDFKVAYVHGRMRPDEKEYQMGIFASGEARILVATTVIEVGVNVPNASVMIIEDAERFGLSQLHQLRGRVGRGADQSYCILMSRHNISGDTRKRLELMTQTTDGFVIAEADMQMRGPGDIEGTLQSGTPFDLRLTNLAADGAIVQMARDAAEVLLDSDPTLSQADNAAFRRELQATVNRTADWSKIS